MQTKEEKFTHKIDPRSIHADQRKQDTRRDAWDRDYMGSHYIKTEPTTKKISNAAPVFVFAFFYVCILVMMGSIR